MSPQDIDQCLNALFSPVEVGKEKQQYSDAVTAFQNLTGYYLEELLGETPFCKRLLKALRFDFVGLMSMLKHFQRDAYGLKSFEKFTQDLVTQGKVSEEVQQAIFEQASALGLRVTTTEPRKTRIAATFTLWMCVYRPVTFDLDMVPECKPESLELFCATLNFWIASAFLGKFGDIILHDLEDADVRYQRIKHDFTVREVSFSTLEALYCSYFKPFPSVDASKNPLPQKAN